MVTHVVIFLLNKEYQKEKLLECKLHIFKCGESLEKIIFSWCQEAGCQSVLLIFKREWNEDA